MFRIRHLIVGLALAALLAGCTTTQTPVDPNTFNCPPVEYSE